MGKTNLYTVKDYRTGEVLAKGTAGELEASGIVPKGYPHQRVGQAREPEAAEPEIRNLF